MHVLGGRILARTHAIAPSLPLWALRKKRSPGQPPEPITHSRYFWYTCDTDLACLHSVPAKTVNFRGMYNDLHKILSAPTPEDNDLPFLIRHRRPPLACFLHFRHEKYFSFLSGLVCERMGESITDRGHIVSISSILCSSRTENWN